MDQWSIVQGHVNLALVDLHCVARCVFGGGHAHGLARFDVKFGPVPGADQAVAIELAIAEGATVMGAHILDAMDLSIDFNHDDKAVIDLKGLRLIRAELLSGTDVMELRHSWSFLLLVLFYSY